MTDREELAVPDAGRVKEPVRLVALAGATVGSLREQVLACEERKDDACIAADFSTEGGCAWVVLRLPTDGSEEALGWLIASLKSVPGDAVVVEVLRQDTSPSGNRTRWVPRAFRCGAVPGRIVMPDGPVSVTGRTVRASGIVLTGTRAMWADAEGLAERDENLGDWPMAHIRWRLLAESAVAGQSAYPWTRAGIALAVLGSQASVVGECFARAVAEGPGFPEGFVRLAQVRLSSGREDDARRLLTLAGAVVPDPAHPQPVGIGTWWIPAQAARMLACRGEKRAAEWAALAVGQGATEQDIFDLAGAADLAEVGASDAAARQPSV